MTPFRRVPPVYSPLSASALAAGWGAWLRPADAVGALEAVLRTRFAAEAALLTDSGTSALTLAISAALRRHAGAPVALPAYCCYDVATAAVAAGVPVLLYDVDPVTLGPDWDSLEQVIHAGAGAVVVAHLFGVAVDVDRAVALVRSKGVVVIEDAAQGAGASLRGRALGAIGPLAVLSFGRGKGITGGAGGALLGRGVGAELVSAAAETLGAPAPSFAPLVAATAQWLLGRPPWYGIPAAIPMLRLGQTVYRSPRAPRRIGAGPAAVVDSSYRLAEHEAETRRAQAARLHGAAMRSAGVRTIAPVADSTPGYLRFPLWLASPPDGHPAREGRMLGVARGYPRSLADLDELSASLGDRQGALAGARGLARHLHTLPTHSLVRPVGLDRLEQWLQRLAGS